MTNNKKFLKKLLATSAVVGTLAAGAMEAQAYAAATTTITVGPAVMSTGVNTKTNGAAPGAPGVVPSGNWVFIGGGAPGLVAFDSPVGTTYNFNLYGNNAKITLTNGVLANPNMLTLVNDVSAAAIAAAGVANGAPLPPGVVGAPTAGLIFGDAGVYQINNNASLPLLGAVDFADLAGTLNINASGTITGSFSGKAAGGGAAHGTVAVLAGKSVAFKGAGADMFNGGGNVTQFLTGGNGTTITIDSTTAAQDLTGTAIKFSTVAGEAGILNLITGTAKAGNALIAHTIDGNVAITVTTINGANFTAGNIGAANAVISVTDTTVSTATRTYGSIHTSGAAGITIGQIAAKAGAVTVGGAMVADLGDISIGTNGAALAVNAATATAGAVNLSTNAGTLTINGALIGKTGVVIAQTGAGALNANGQAITAQEGDIAITAGTTAIAGDFGLLSAVGGNVSLDQGIAPASGGAGQLTIAGVQTGQFTYNGNFASTLTLDGPVSLSNLVLGNDTKTATAVIFADDANTYVGNVSLANDKQNIFTINTAVGNTAYFGTIGDAAHRLAAFNLNAAGGTVAIIDGGTVNAIAGGFTANNGQTVILGNESTLALGGNLAVVNANGGIIKIESVLAADQPAAGKAIGNGVLKAGQPAAAAITGGGIGDNANAVTNIDFSAAGVSSLTVGAGTDAATDLGVYTKGLGFSATAGALGTLELTGGKNHILNVVALGAGVLNPQQGAISSDTANNFTITGTLGAVGAAAPWTQDSLASISAPNAANVILNGGDVYTQALVMKAGSELTLGDSTGAGDLSYLIGSLTDGVKIATAKGVAARSVIFESGTDLGSFALFQITDAATTVVFKDMDLNGTAINPANTKSGNVVFAGTSIVNSALGSAAPLDTVWATPAAGGIAANPTVTFNGDINAVNGLKVDTTNDSAIVKVGCNITGPTPTTAGINYAIAGGGKNADIYFVNANPITISGDISGVANFRKVDVGTSVVTIGNAATFTTAAVNFSGNGNFVLQKVGAAVLNGVAITSNATAGATLSFDNDMTRVAADGDIGTQGKFLNLNLTADKTITTTDTNIYANLTTGTPGAGTYVGHFDGANGAGAAAGVGGSYTIQDVTDYKVVDLSGITNGAVINAGTVNGAAFKFGSAAAAANAATLNLMGTSGLQLLSVNAASDIVNVKTGGSVSGITTAVANKGIINFLGNGTIAGDLGGALALEAINMQGGSQSTVVMSGNVYAPVTQDATALKLAQNSVINGTYTTTGSTVQAGNYVLTTTGVATLGGNNFSITANLNSDQQAGGVVFNSLALANNNITIPVTVTNNADSSVALPADGTKWQVMSIANPDANSAKLAQLVKSGNIIVTDQSNNAFLKLTPYVDNTGIYYTTTRDLSSLIASVNASGATLDVKQFASLLNTQASGLQGQALGFATALGVVGKVDSAQQGEMLERMTGSSDVHMSLDSVSGGMGNIVSGRVATLETNRSADASDALGTSAGDSASKMGAWISGFGSQGNQGSRKGDAGYRTKIFGGVIGFDTALNDSMAVGLAAGTANVKTKYKNFKSGDSTTATAYMFSLYGSYDFGNSWVAQAFATFGNGSVKNKSLRKVGLGNSYETATGKFNTMTGGGEVLGGYKFDLGGTSTVTPLAGLAYTRTSENAYKETGTRFSNLSVSDRTQDKLEGILGLRAMTSMDMDGTLVTPEFHGFMNYNFKTKAPKVTVSLDGLNGNVPVQAAKAARVSCNLGVSVMAKTDMVEYGLGYDSDISDKYFAHQGTLKLRVNF